MFFSVFRKDVNISGKNIGLTQPNELPVAIEQKSIAVAYNTITYIALTISQVFSVNKRGTTRWALVS